VPEGDTIAKAARVLERALTGKTLVRVEIRRRSAAPEPGVRVLEVEAIGKHLMIRFDNGRTLHTHMQMTAAGVCIARATVGPGPGTRLG